jgi:hypothetical protein
MLVSCLLNSSLLSRMQGGALTSGCADVFVQFVVLCLSFDS